MKSAAVKKHFTFVGGLNTEAGPLTSPPNVWVDGDNIIPDADGAISLRTAIDYESDYELSGTTQSSSEAAAGAYVAAEWNNVGGNGNHHMLVVQRGPVVSFYTNGGTTVTSQRKTFTINLANHKVATNLEPSGVAPISVANANGALIIVSRDTEPLLVTYDAATDNIVVEELVLKIRDFMGLDDGLDIDEKPAALSDEHNYNLLNQGWNSANITAYHTATSTYPSNAQQWTAGKDSSDNFSSALLDKQDFGTSPAPKGRFILNLFNRDRTDVSGVANLTAEVENYRPTTCAFFAGRAWYGGVRSRTISTWVMFSQVALTKDNLGKCYQDADPTSEVVSDLVASDGGVIPIQDAGALVKLLPFGNSMLVICDNGIWQIVGGIESGFSATSYEVRKLSTVGCVSAQSVVHTEAGVLFWGEDGIYVIAANQVGGVAVQPLSLDTVQTLYNEIPMLGKFYASATYNPTERIVYWLYNDDEEQDGANWRFAKNRILCLDLQLKAYYTMTIGKLDNFSPTVVSAFTTRARQAIGEQVQVVETDGDVVVDSNGDNVVASQSGVGSFQVNPVTVKFLVVHSTDEGTYDITVGEFDFKNDAPRKFRDWYSRDEVGTPVLGYLITGYDMGGEDQGGDKQMQALYVTVFLRRTETGVDSDGNAINPSSCLMQGRWDWTDHAGANRWSTPQQVYRHVRPWTPAAVPSDTFEDGHPVVVTKNKLRGRGRALQIKFANEADKDMQILGWAITYLGNANV